jgi:hypothetical protein
MNIHRQPNTAHRQPFSFLPGPMSYCRLHPIKPANTLFSVSADTALQCGLAIVLRIMDARQPKTDPRKPRLPSSAHFAEPRSIIVREAARDIVTSVDKGQVSPSSVGLRVVAMSRRSHERQRYA